MHEFEAVSLGRAHRVLEERLRPAIHSARTPLRVAAHVVDGEPIPVAAGLAADYAPVEPGRRWGRAWDTTWFRIEGDVPAALAGRRLEVVADLGFDPKEILPGPALRTMHFYLGATPGLPQAEITAWRAALDAMKADGSYARIIAQAQR